MPETEVPAQEEVNFFFFFNVAMIKNSVQNFSVGSLLVAARCRAGRERSPRDPCGPCWGGEGGH